MSQTFEISQQQLDRKLQTLRDEYIKYLMSKPKVSRIEKVKTNSCALF
jgi:hypothetical protein